MKLVYIASPYSHADKKVMQRRFEEVRDFTASVMQVLDEVGVVPFSPITHSHEIACLHDLPKTHEFWLKMDETFIRHAAELWVLMLPGWDVSRGVASEVAFARSIHIPVMYKCNRKL